METKIQYKDIPEQEIANLIAWYARQKGKEIIIHADDGDVIVKFVKKRTTISDDDIMLFANVAACACLF